MSSKAVTGGVLILVGVLTGMAQAPKSGAFSPVNRDLVGWAEPAVGATPSQPVKFRTAMRFHYTQQQFQPVFTVTPIARTAARYNTPEDAMLARVSAIVTGDYDWWLSIWDAGSRKEQEERMKAPGEAEKMVAGWKDLYAHNHIELQHKIAYGQYVIVTYKVVPNGAGQGNPSEFPTVFHLEGGAWKSTNDLRSDPLVPMSPWNTGKSEYEESFK